MTTPELPALKASTYTRNSPKSEPVARSYTAKSVKAREHALLSRIAQLEHMWREAEDRALCAEEAAMSHAARIIELENAK